MKLLLLGGSGAMGQAFLRSAGSGGLSVFAPHSNELDVLNTERVMEFVHEMDIDCVVNMTARGVRDECSTHELMGINALAPRLVAEALAWSGTPKRFLHIASALEPEVDEPAESAYAESKAIGTRGVAKVALCHPDVCKILSLPSTYGARNQDGFIGQSLDAACRGVSFHVRFPNRMREFCWFEDAIAATILVVNEWETFPTRNSAVTNDARALRDVAHTVYQVAGADVELVESEDQGVDKFMRRPRKKADMEIVCPTPLEVGVRTMMEGYL